jgi:hypothetical protein
MLLLLLMAFADEPKIIYKEKTEIDFEALDIEGATKKPTLTNVSGVESVIFNSLIQPRKDFFNEMAESLEEIE